ncbi:tetratricopeptide repeat protein [Candidatus Thiosymbion oneisti]|uniref:tetratricopeptide repeat protein n=1 Tax=Candidatus Thiosymbion oneisti TaxID=589554 RepID=UPI00159F181F|nr:tetratricopeptide repeat protein [Candidatus Thiosymbion oneisti]
MQLHKNRQRLRTILIGLPALVLGIGWAVSIALAEQSNGDTATNDAVTNPGPQDPPTVVTGSEDTVDIRIGITLEEYAAGLKRREREVTEELKQAQAEERRILEAEKTELERRLADTAASYQTHIEELKKRIAQLETSRGEVPDDLLDQVLAALVQGDSDKADQLLAQFEVLPGVSALTAAEAAYQRSQVAWDELRYQEAYKHAQRAVELAPDNSRYLIGAALLPWRLGDYGIAKDYLEQALAGDLERYGEDHPNVAIDRGNLGMVWYALGEYQKAIGYYEQALASHLQTYGEDHPDVAIRRNNLGLAWQRLGDYQQAIGYYERALPIAERRLGREHPHTRIIRHNLTAVRTGQIGNR